MFHNKLCWNTFGTVLKFKGNTQFLFLCKPPKSGAWGVCITFLQITQEILTKDIIHLLELYFWTIIWTFTSKLPTILGATYIHCFSLTLINVFYMFSIDIHICLYYFLILCSYFYLLFLTLLATRHILQFTMFDSISLQPAHHIREIKKNTL